MSDTKISDLSAGSTPIGADLIPGVSSGSNVKFTVTQIMNAVLAILGDTDGAMAGNSDSKFATQKAVKTYADALIAANDAMVFKGSTDCSSNPNYPAANRGDTYRVSVAGKIGGASGTVVEAGDLFMCLDDSTSSGTQAAQGSHWTVVQANLDGAVIGPASATDLDLVRFDGTSGKLIKAGIALDTDTTLAANSDSKVATQKAVKAYVTANVGAGLSDGDKGDITVSSSGAVWSIDNDVVTYGKLQNISATSRILGRKTTGAGDTEECTLSDVLDFIGSAAQGDILYRGASSWARLAAGTNGDYLQTQGGSANPRWNTVSASFTGGTLTTALNEAPKSTLASASTTNIGAADKNVIQISGTTTITAFDTIADGAYRELTFDGAVTLTHNSVSLILPGGANVTTAAGDIAGFRSLGGGNWRCVKYVRASGTALVSTGLNYFAEALVTSSPNNSVNQSTLTPQGGTSSQAFIIKWKGGSGYIAVQVRDDTSTGGNARGNTAIDFQSARASASQVASGTGAGILAGTSCTASGSYAQAGGNACAASGDYSSAFGTTNTSDSDNTFAIGSNANTRSVSNTFAQGGGGSSGKYQVRRNMLRNSSAFNNVTKQMTTDGTTAGTGNIPILTNSSACLFTVKALVYDGTDAFGVTITGLITRGANAASTAIIGSNTTVATNQTAGVAGKSWTITVTADTTNGGLNVSFTPDNGAVVTGRALVEMVEAT